MMDQITIKDLEVYANHGLYKEEKVLGQKFLVSAVLYVDTKNFWYLQFYRFIRNLQVSVIRWIIPLIMVKYVIGSKRSLQKMTLT